jgi:hypothetical protein
LLAAPHFAAATPLDSECGGDCGVCPAGEDRSLENTTEWNIAAPNPFRANNILFAKRLPALMMLLCRLRALQRSPISSKIRDNHLGAGRTH